MVAKPISSSGKVMQQLPKKLLSSMIGRGDHPVDPREFKKILFQATILPIALSLLLSILFVKQIYTVLEENHKVRHSDEVINTATEGIKLIIDSETGFRGYIITNNEVYLGPWVKAQSKFFILADKIIDLVKDNPIQQKEIREIKTLYTGWNENAEATIAYRKKFKQPSPDEMITARKAIMDSIRRNFDEFIERERGFRNKRWAEAEQASRDAVVVTLALGIVLGISLAVMSILQLRRLSRNYSEAYSSLAAATDHLEETVALRTHELTLVNKELEAFSYSVSHDLRAPLRGIDGFSQILAEEYSDKLDGEAIKYLGFIRSGVQRMGVLIDDLINLSRLTRAEFRKEDVEISQVASGIIADLKQNEPQRKFEFTNFLPQIVSADPGLLRAALQNLISNAWKYSRTREVSIIELGQIYKDGKVTFYVKDNGVGFDMRFYDKLFQPFQRLHPKEQFDGSGIGLATVGRIIRRHNGSIWGESELGKGSTFYFTLGA